MSEKANPLLADYPRPSVAVDTAVLTVTDAGELAVLLVRTADDQRLPGTFLHEGETLAEAVLRSLTQKAGIDGLSPTQLQVFDDPHRDDRGWVLSVAHLDAVRLDRLGRMDDSRATITPVRALPELPYGHERIIARAVTALRSDYADHPDPRGLLGAPFTLRQLHSLHEAVAGSSLPRDTFRRAMEPQLASTGLYSRGGAGKPARLFDHIPTTALTEKDL
jgi:8-oxo-dGTP diphosphatase